MQFWTVAIGLWFVGFVGVETVALADDTGAPPLVCGDGVCDAYYGEDPYSCSADCGVG